jgi:hypothetical protein
MNPKNIGKIGVIQASLVTGCILLSQVFLSKAIWSNTGMDRIRDNKLLLLLNFLFAVRDCGMFLYIIPISWTLLSTYIISGHRLSSKFISFPLLSGIIIIIVLSAIAVNILLISYFIYH